MVRKKVVELGEAGYTDAQIAEIIGVTRQTIHNWKKKDADFFYSLKEAKLKADLLVEEALYNRAVGMSIPETKAFCPTGSTHVITEEITKYLPPDPTSAIFWLKNRQPKLWRDKQEVDNVFKIDNLIFDDEGDDE